eukprot:scaffold32558_cov60-Phaeocystis_antarctica.AAC.4
MANMFMVRFARALPAVSAVGGLLAHCLRHRRPTLSRLPARQACRPLREPPVQLGRVQTVCPTRTRSSPVAHGRAMPRLTVRTVWLGPVWAHARPRRRRRRRHRHRLVRLRPAPPATIQRSSGPTGWPTMCASPRCPCIRTTRQELPAPQDTTNPSDPATLANPDHAYTCPTLAHINTCPSHSHLTPFQILGEPMKYYNVISAPTISLNAQ